MYTYVKCGLAVMKQPQQLAWQVFDSKTLHLLRDEYRMKQATRLRADTLEALADKMEGINRDAFVKTVREFNSAVRTEVPFNVAIKDGRCTVGIDPPK
jgi:tricarballylate dehydrogenase